MKLRDLFLAGLASLVAGLAVPAPSPPPMPEPSPLAIDVALIESLTVEQALDVLEEVSDGGLDD